MNTCFAIFSESSPSLITLVISIQSEETYQGALIRGLRRPALEVTTFSYAILFRHHMSTSNCTGIWEMWSSDMPRKKSKTWILVRFQYSHLIFQCLQFAFFQFIIAHVNHVLFVLSSAILDVLVFIYVLLVFKFIANICKQFHLMSKSNHYLEPLLLLTQIDHYLTFTYFLLIQTLQSCQL